MLGLTWFRSLIARRTGRIAAAAAGVALAVGLLASIGAFVASSKATMTARAATRAAVDWQVAVQGSADPTAVLAAVQTQPHVVAAVPVGFARSPGLTSTTAAGATTTQSTGAAVVVGFPADYRTRFPGSIRPLVGSDNGAVLAQQTAANLHAAPGDTVSIARVGLPAVDVTITGVIDLPQADSLFQTVGSPIGAQPTAPPDNIVVLPLAQWHQVFDPLVAAHAELVSQQVHARLDHMLPGDPSAAYTQVAAMAHNLEARLAGGGAVGDNLGATLAAARSDALYAQILFLFLGLPGAILAGLLTVAIAAAGSTRRRQEQALLRLRGATLRVLVRLGAIEGVLVAVIGSVLGLALGAIVGRAVLGASAFGNDTATSVTWAVAACTVGAVIALSAVAYPAWRDAREITVNTSRRSVARTPAPRWLRWGLDVILLAGSAVVVWLAGQNGYHLVLAVEGVPTVSVSYWALLGPALLWIGAGLLTWRITHLVLTRGRRPLRAALRPASGPLSDTVAATMQRQRRPIARAVALVALTVGFAASTAIFNATYRQQARVDALLTNGADVTVTPAPGANLSPGSTATLRGLPEVRSVETIQHRYAYVGTDLQDLYGVNPATIIAATDFQNAYVQGGTARSVMAELAAKPDSILVSAETVKDFQLQPGDLLTLRLQQTSTKALVDVPFHFAGVAKEFPTAPKDSFLIANGSYVADKTGSDAVGAFLLNTGGQHRTDVAAAARNAVGPGPAITDLDTSRQIIGSSLTAVDLAGLTKIELGFALALVAAATGLLLWLGLAERRRTFAITSALGATNRQQAGFVWGEAGFVAITGTIAGAAIAWALSHVLVTVLTGVFDPPPETLAIPWGYLAVVAASALTATAVAAQLALRSSRHAPIELLRESP